MIYGGLIFIFFIIAILYCLNDIRGLIIPAIKQTVEIIFIVIGSMFLMGGTYLYAKTWVHIILGILGTALFILSWARIGITLKWFNAVRGFGRVGSWANLKNVQVSLGNYVKVSFITRNLNENIHYYKKEDYDRIINLLLENLSGEIVKIR
jgi:hypothetical protein